MELRGNMEFSQDEASAKKGQAMRVLRRLPDRRDVKIGSLGKVVGACLLIAKGWVLEAEFELPGGDIALVLVERDAYDRCLEKC